MQGDSDPAPAVQAGLQPAPAEMPAGSRPKAMELFKQSFAILKGDKELVLFPVMAMVFSLLAAVVIGGLYLAVFFFVTNQQANTAAEYAFTFVYYLAIYYIILYYNCGLAACVLSNFQGNQADYKYGINIAKKHRRAIFGYALLAATVGLILRWIAERFGIIGRIISSLLNITWSLATIFIAPVLITTDLPPTQAVKESARIFEATWGTAIKGSIGFGVAALLGMMAAFAPLVIGLIGGNAIFIAIGALLTVIAVIGWSLIVSTCSSIYRTALFRYATSKQVPPGFGSNLPLAVKTK